MPRQPPKNSTSSNTNTILEYYARLKREIEDAKKAEASRKAAAVAAARAAARAAIAKREAEEKAARAAAVRAAAVRAAAVRAAAAAAAAAAADAEAKTEFLARQQNTSMNNVQLLPKTTLMISPDYKINIPSNDIKPYIYYLTSYIYLQKASYKFVLNTNNMEDVYTKTLLNIYEVDNTTNEAPLPVSQNNTTTSKWVNISKARFYKIEVYMAILSESFKNEALSFAILATDKEIIASTASSENSDSESEYITFASKDFEYVDRSISDTYTNMKDFIYNVDDVDKFKEIYNTVLNEMSYSPTKNVSFLEDLETRYAEIRNYFLGETGTSRRTEKYDADIKQLEIDKGDQLKTNADIIAINSLLDENNDDSLVKLNLQSKLSIPNPPTINTVAAHDTFNITPDSDIINQYITYEQTNHNDKATLRGGDEIFNMLSHANRSIYVEAF
jgi:hypothetical protein